MGWDALQLWDQDARRIKRFTNGVANEVWSVTIRDQKAVARLGSRSDAGLQWETNLLIFLDRNGICVPKPIPTLDGRLFANGLVVMEHLDGTTPKTKDDWKRVTETIRHVHELTKDWPQRPGWKSSIDLINSNSGTKIDLTAMPAEGVKRCRNAWRKIEGLPQSVVHGDLNPGNILMSGDKVALIDWDESRVDVSSLDLALSHNAAEIDADRLEKISQAVSAWEAAVCWDDDYSKKRLAEVKPV